MSDTGVTGIRHFVKAFGYSLAGLRAALRHEAAFRQELAMCAALVPIGLWFGNGPVERALLIGSLLLVLVVELINSAIEAVVDRVSEAHHPLSGRAKDIGSAAVFVALLNASVIWFLILVAPRL